MKRYLLIVFLLLSVCGVAAAASVVSYGTNGIVGFSVGATSSFGFQAPTNFGVNYGHFSKTYASFGPSGTITTDFATMKAAGVKNLRIVLDDPTNASSTGVDLDLATTSVSNGFYTSYGYGGTGATSGVSSSSIGTYMATTVSTIEPLLQAGGIQEMTLGNEMEETLDNTSISTSTFQKDINRLACQVKAAGFTGLVSYQAQSEEIANWNTTWAALTPRCLDLIGFNIYGGASTMTTNAATLLTDFGTAGYISEWNDDGNSITGGINKFGGNQQQWAAEVQSELIALKATSLPKYYYFTYRSDNTYQSGGIDQWAVYTENGIRQYLAQVLAI